MRINLIFLPVFLFVINATVMGHRSSLIKDGQRIDILWIYDPLNTKPKV